jgi:hypothetical protein
LPTAIPARVVCRVRYAVATSTYTEELLGRLKVGLELLEKPGNILG